jgi:hypothetical protein
VARKTIAVPIVAQLTASSPRFGSHCESILLNTPACAAQSPTSLSAAKYCELENEWQVALETHPVVVGVVVVVGLVVGVVLGVVSPHESSLEWIVLDTNASAAAASATTALWQASPPPATLNRPVATKSHSIGSPSNEGSNPRTNLLSAADTLLQLAELSTNVASPPVLVHSSPTPLASSPSLLQPAIAPTRTSVCTSHAVAADTPRWSPSVPTHTS